MDIPLEDLVMLSEVEARRALSAQSATVALSVLAPVGSYAGRGMLRVLRALPRYGRIELVCGYEAYEPFR